MVQTFFNDNKTTKKHLFSDYEAFIDSDNDFYIITEDSCVCLTLKGDSENEFCSINRRCYNYIEDFCCSEMKTTLIKAFKQEDYTITISSAKEY